MWLPWIILCALMSIALFVGPYHRVLGSVASYSKPRSLLAVIRRECRWSRTGKLRNNLAAVGLSLSLLVVFLPPMMLWQLSLVSTGQWPGLRFVILVEAIALLLGCAISILAILMSDMTIGFGTPVRQTKNTLIAWLIPVYEISFALGAIIAAVIL